MELFVALAVAAVLWRAVGRASDQAEAKRWLRAHPVPPPARVVKRHCCHEHERVVVVPSRGKGGQEKR